MDKQNENHQSKVSTYTALLLYFQRWARSVEFLLHLFVYFHLWRTLLFHVIWIALEFSYNFWIWRSHHLFLAKILTKCVTYSLVTWFHCSRSTPVVSCIIIFYVQNSKYEFIYIFCFLLDDIPRGTCRNLKFWT